MRKIGKTVILNETESLYQGKCNVDLVNKSDNIISLHRTTGELKILKVKRVNASFKKAICNGI